MSTDVGEGVKVVKPGDVPPKNDSEEDATADVSPVEEAEIFHFQ